MSTEDSGLLQFPCEFALKVMGKNSTTFEAVVLAVLRQHLPDLREGAVSLRESKEKKYLAMTVTFIATSQAQIDQIYTDLSASKEVIMAL